MTNDQHRSQFRLPYPLYERLKEAAEENKRSLNAEIVDRLTCSFGASADPAENLARIIDERDARLLDAIRSMIAPEGR